MLDFLGTQRTTSERKLRLFAAVCCRRVWEWLGERSRRAVHMLELHFDGIVTADEFSVAARGAYEDWIEEFGTHHPSNAAYVATSLGSLAPHAVAKGAAAQAAEAVRCATIVEKGTDLQGWGVPQVVEQRIRQLSIEAGAAAMSVEGRGQCQCLRDIFTGQPARSTSASIGAQAPS
jgi:hypothetical protein